jgi:hypothetical protein
MANMSGQDQVELSPSPLLKQMDITPTTTCQFNKLPTEVLQQIMRELLEPNILLELPFLEGSSKPGSRSCCEQR